MKKIDVMNNMNYLVFLFTVAVFFASSAQGGSTDGTLDGVLNATYTIEGKEVTLIDGCHEELAAPGSVRKIKTMVFGKPVHGELDGDGDEDGALLILQDSGGSGTFYYVAAALKENGKYSGTSAVLLGDRISPRSIQIRDGVIVVTYAGRRPDEPMSALPTVGKTKHLRVEGGRLANIRRNEGDREGRGGP